MCWSGIPLFSIPKGMEQPGREEQCLSWGRTTHMEMPSACLLLQLPPMPFPWLQVLLCLTAMSWSLHCLGPLCAAWLLPNYSHLLFSLEILSKRNVRNLWCKET